MVDDSDQDRIKKNSAQEEDPPEYYELWMKETAGGMCLYICNNDKPFTKLRTPDGSTVEVDAHGNVWSAFEGDMRTAVKGGSTDSINENRSSKGYGHSQNFTGGQSSSEAGGDSTSGVGTGLTIVVMGKANIRAQFAYLGTDQDCNINCGGNMNMDVKGNLTRTVGGTDSTKAAKITHN